MLTIGFYQGSNAHMKDGAALEVHPQYGLKRYRSVMRLNIAYDALRWQHKHRGDGCTCDVGIACDARRSCGAVLAGDGFPRYF